MQGWIIRIAIIAVVVIGGVIFRDRLSGSAGDLKVGDCFDVPTANVDVKSVQHHPCTESHTGEVFAQVTNPAAKGAAPLSQAQLIDYIGTACGQAWVTYIGQDAVASKVFDFGAFYPQDKDWKDGDRGMTCYTYRLDGAAMTSSVKK